MRCESAWSHPQCSPRSPRRASPLCRSPPVLGIAISGSRRPRRSTGRARRAHQRRVVLWATWAGATRGRSPEHRGRADDGGGGAGAYPGDAPTATLGGGFGSAWDLTRPPDQMVPRTTCGSHTARAVFAARGQWRTRRSSRHDARGRPPWVDGSGCGKPISWISPIPVKAGCQLNVH